MENFKALNFSDLDIDSSVLKLSNLENFRALKLVRGTTSHKQYIFSLKNYVESFFRAHELFCLTSSACTKTSFKVHKDAVSIIIYIDLKVQCWVESVQIKCNAMLQFSSITNFVGAPGTCPLCPPLNRALCTKPHEQ